MAEISPKTIKQLRDMTGAGMMDCKKAMEAADGDLDKAVVWLREQGIAKAAKRQDRATSNGVIEAYLHRTGDYPPQTGALIELDCESDFVAKGDDFRALARDLCLHIAAAAPRWITRDEVPAELLDEERAVYRNKAAQEGKPAQIIEKIAEGKLKTWFAENVLVGPLIAILTLRFSCRSVIRR